MSSVNILKPIVEVQLELPRYETNVPAGFPSPCDEYSGDTLDLNEHLITNSTATFFAKVEGDSMIGAGIFEGDLLVVDRSLNPVQNSIVIAVVNNEFTVKRLCFEKGIRLMPENNEYKPICFSGENELIIWGVVKAVVRKL